MANREKRIGRGKRVLAVLTTLALTTTALAVMSFGESQAPALDPENPAEIDLNSLLDSAGAAGKEETVYVIADANGNPNQIIVSEWLKNPDQAKELQDQSNLTDIKNVEGDQTYSINEEGMMVWNAEGEDICYQGTTNQELPVGISVSYQLDGKDISAEDLAGQSGEVTIRFTYTNNQYEMVSIDGTTQKMYVPFVMLTGMILENDNFSDVEVTNGRVINDGNKQMVLGYALPGLQENLGVGKDQLDVPDYVEIKAQAKDFQLGTTLTLASNEVFNALDFSSVSSVDDLMGQLNQFSEAAQQLVSGSQTLSDRMGDLVSGASKLESGATTIRQGLGQLAAQNGTLRGGADQVFATLLTSATTQVNTAIQAYPGAPTVALTQSNYGSQLDSVITYFDGGTFQAIVKNQVITALSQDGTVRAQVTAAVRNQVLAGVVNAQLHMSLEEYQAGIADGTITSGQVDAINAAVDGQMAGQDIDAAVQNFLTNTPDGQALVAQYQAQSTDGAKAQIEAARSGLDSYAQFQAGIYAYTDGVQQLYAGAGTMETGASELSAGAVALQAGAGELAAGMSAFNEEGVEKILGMFEGDLGTVVTRLQATVDVSRDYTNFGGIQEGTKGTVKFIYKTAEITA